MMDRLMEDAWVRPSGSWGQGGEGFGSFPFDLYETGDDFVITAALPGLKPEDLDLSVQGNVLTISGEFRTDEREDQERSYHIRERRYGKVSRQLTLPTGIQGDRIQASLEHGVLTLHVPKAEAMKPRRIQVQTGTASTPQQITSGEHRAA
jgi:HSP20 family protein